MKIDFADVFASGVGWILKQMLLFTVSVWFACMLAGAAYQSGEIVRGYSLDMNDVLWIVVVSPLLLLTAWIIPNALFLGAMGYQIVVNSDSGGFRSWGMLIAGESLFAMAGVHHFLPKKWMPITVAWVTWVHLIVMALTGLWILYHWNLNRFARQLVALKAENSFRRAELKKVFGTENAGLDETGMI